MGLGISIPHTYRRLMLAQHVTKIKTNQMSKIHIRHIQRNGTGYWQEISKGFTEKKKQK